MNLYRSALIIALLAVSTAGMIAYAGQAKGTTTTPARPPVSVSADVTYSATSVDGNLQEALTKVLQAAQAAATKQISDATFNWQLDTVSGKRGGLMGSQEVTVKIHIVK